MSTYQVLGRSIAGSFFIECLLREAGADYEFVHVSRTRTREADFTGTNPLARIPVLITPDGQNIIESMAIFTHLVEAFPQLAPQAGTEARHHVAASGGHGDKPLPGFPSVSPHPLLRA